MRNIYVLLPRLISKAGHIFHYNVSVQKALESIGWRYHAYPPRKTSVSPLPDGWNAVLANDISEAPKSLWQKLKILFANILPIRRIFQAIKGQESAVVFIEHFELQHLVSVAVALIFIKPKFHFWMVYRNELEGRWIKSALCRIFLRFMYSKLGEEKIRCLTDSDLLAESLEKDLHCRVFVLPIPHTEGKIGRRGKQEENVQSWWWPGGLIREEKGLHKIHQILNLLKERKDVRLVVAEKGREIFTDHSNINFVPTLLSRDEYVDWMQNADLILLPYMRTDYSRRTSGIFVEAISLGALPVTTKGTWMAYELDKFDLSELAFDWDESNLVDRLFLLRTNFDLKRKIEVMRAHYQKFHSPSGFASVIQKL